MMCTQVKALLFSIGVFLFFRAPVLSAEEKIHPRSMASLGDSITAGALANTDRSAKNGNVLTKLIFLGIRMSFFRSLRGMEIRRLSWSTGVSKWDQMHSHAERLMLLEKGAFRRFNGAFSGARSSDLKDQWAQVSRWSSRRLAHKAPDYVTLLVGANDLCENKKREMTSVEDFYKNINESLFRIKAKNPETKILVSSIPNVVHLKKTAQHSRAGFFKNCQKLWERLNVCSNVLNSDPNELDRAEERLHDFNDVLKELAQKYAHRGTDDSVRFVPEVYQYEFDPDQLASDCFHPNKKGQAVLADITWEASWWGEPK